jgi:hypothetical protein
MAPVEPGHDPPPDPDRVALVLGEVVGEPRHAGVHLRTAERLVVGLLTGGPPRNTLAPPRTKTV